MHGSSGVPVHYEQTGTGPHHAGRHAVCGAHQHHPVVAAQVEFESNVLEPVIHISISSAEVQAVSTCV